MCFGCTSSEPVGPADYEGITRQAWKIIGDNYYDPGMEGLDWAAVGRTYIGRTKSTNDQIDLYFNTLSPMAMLLENSHVGVSPPGSNSRKAQGSAMAAAKSGLDVELCLGMHVAEGRRGSSSRFVEVDPTSLLFPLGVRAGWRLFGVQANPENADALQFQLMATDGTQTAFVVPILPAERAKIAEELRVLQSAIDERAQPYRVMRLPAIGASVRIGSPGALRTVVNLERNSPAEKAGISPGSGIPTLTIKPLGADRFAYSATLTPEGGNPHKFEAEVVCERGSNLPVRAARLLEGSVLYLRFDRFEDDVASWVAAELTKRSYQAVLLDLRWNAGGDIEELRRVMALFLGADKVLGTMYPRRGADQAVKTVAPPIASFDGKMAVLVSPISASAAETAASALKAHGIKDARVVAAR